MTNKIDFLAPPSIGTVVMLAGQKYEMVNVDPYVTASGRRTSVLTWRTSCPTCAKPFDVTTGLVAKAINRRCPEHRAALKPVSGNRKKVKAKVVSC